MVKGQKSESPTFESVGGVPLIRDLVYRSLLENILEGRLKPGERIVERDIAARIGVSTMPVKEALRRLEIEGFVTSFPRRGVIVSETAAAPITDLFDVRLALESLAARLAAARVRSSREAVPGNRSATTEEIERLQQSVEALSRIPDSVDEAVLINETFHTIVREMSDNAFLTQHVAKLLELDSVLRRRVLADPAEIRRAAKEHRRVGEAILRGEPDEAEKAMYSHISASRARNHS